MNVTKSVPISLGFLADHLTAATLCCIILPMYSNPLPIKAQGNVFFKEHDNIASLCKGLDCPISI